MLLLLWLLLISLMLRMLMLDLIWMMMFNLTDALDAPRLHGGRLDRVEAAVIHVARTWGGVERVEVRCKSPTDVSSPDSQFHCHACLTC